MLFLNFNSEHVDSFKSKFHDVALLYKGKGIGFLLGEIEASQGPFEVIAYSPPQFLLVFLYDILFWYVYFVFGFGEQYFGLQDDDVPLLFILNNDNQKYLKPNLEPDQIAPWLKQYMVKLLLMLPLILIHISDALFFKLQNAVCSISWLQYEFYFIFLFFINILHSSYYSSYLFVFLIKLISDLQCDHVSGWKLKAIHKIRAHSWN